MGGARSCLTADNWPLIIFRGALVTEVVSRPVGVFAVSSGLSFDSGHGTGLAPSNFAVKGFALLVSQGFQGFHGFPSFLVYFLLPIATRAIKINQITITQVFIAPRKLPRIFDISS